MISDPTALSVAALRRALAARETTAVAVAEAHLARIQALDDRLHAFATVTAVDALAAARAADAALARGEAGPLAGIPVGVKDLMAVRGVVRTNGSPAFAGDPPAGADATVVARLRAAGAIVLGTTHMHELAYGPTGVNPALGTPVNPWGADRVPGGSSSGSGVAVAGRLVPVSLGSDTGGSIRIPASCCGITGLKPTYGRVSRGGVTPLAWSLDHIGPLARSAEDVALVLQVLAGHDPADPTTARLAAPDFAAAVGRTLDGMRLGIPRDDVLPGIDPAVGRIFEAALGDLRAGGATLTDVGLPMLGRIGPVLGAVIFAEAEAALRPLLGERIDCVAPETRALLELGRLIAARHYLAAQRARTQLYEEISAVFEDVDLLVLPTLPLPPPRLDELFVRLGPADVGVIEALARLTGPFNLAGLPVLAVPCGFTADGLPVGLQLVGRPFAEADVLAAGHAYQRLTDWHTRTPNP